MRETRNATEHEGFRIRILNGKHTGRLGVVEIEPEDRGSELEVTNLERTLIDCVVRPAYAGGVSEVLAAFEASKGRLSVNSLCAMLRKLDYVYPYHQAIGFYLERAGFEESVLRLLDRFPIEFDFYLAHGMKNREFVPRWRLYVPKGF
jgi:hypothetical protein